MLPVLHFKFIISLFLLFIAHNDAAFLQLPSKWSGYNHTVNYQHVKELLTTNFTNVLQLLQAERVTNPLFDKTWKLAEARFEQIRSNLTVANEGMQPLPDECHIALVAYTIDVAGKSLYEDFNDECGKLTTEKAWQNFHYKSYFALLARSMHGVGNNPSLNRNLIYAGLRHQVDDDIKVGDYVYVTDILSGSVDEKLAQQFIGGTHGTVVTLREISTTSLGIANYGYYPYEQQILVFPWSTYQVSLFIKRDDQDDLWLDIYQEFYSDLPYSGNYINKGSTINNDL